MVIFGSYFTFSTSGKIGILFFSNHYIPREDLSKYQTSLCHKTLNTQKIKSYPWAPSLDFWLAAATHPAVRLPLMKGHQATAYSLCFRAPAPRLAIRLARFLTFQAGPTYQWFNYMVYAGQTFKCIDPIISPSVSIPRELIINSQVEGHNTKAKILSVFSINKEIAQNNLLITGKYVLILGIQVMDNSVSPQDGVRVQHIHTHTPTHHTPILW